MAIILVALGSNRCHGRHGRPAGVVRAALVALAGLGLVERVSPILATDPIGPGSRRYANAVAALEWGGSLPDLLRALKDIERVSIFLLPALLSCVCPALPCRTRALLNGVSCLILW